MNRNEMMKRLRRTEIWDLVIIGGGATGLGTAIDAASRGYQILLIEQSDFSKGTSSRSTKLVHGGVRYLQQGNISLVLEALKERGLMRRNAPHLVRNLRFVVPNYDWWEGPFYGIGLKVYDMLSGRQGFGRSKNLSREKTLEYIPTVEPDGLRGGVIYYDGQFDDARLAINMARTAVEQGGTVINYMRVTDLIKEDDVVRGVVAEDAETGESFEIRAKGVINATGVFSDSIRRMDDADVQDIITPSQGVHIVLDKSFLPGDTAIMVPHTDDGRVLFAIPWHDRVVVGTTDTPVEKAELDPRPLDEELTFLLEHTARYLSKDPEPEDVLSAFAGLRPLVSLGGDDENTAAISRDHTLSISRSGLVTITGGKWTTYRKMAEDTVDQAAMLALLEDKPCVTKDLNIHGFHRNADKFGPLADYGSDALGIQDIFGEKPEYGEPLHPSLPHRAGEVIWAVRHEMARTVEDFLARRTRALLLDARASVEMAPKVAQLMAEALGRDEAWQRTQVAAYEMLSRDYLMGG
ncbi:glycerol-3-phosphate dehydrogenase/oxidase [Desulfonema ishimotonii]|uniref:Glycerol-3-phosphate dehydrogenase/oxidase n=1 Tax=Desulfonema ishimotonii TaxID=45657 RepID=A0A401FXA3_9BACT|nr:glycerol-3-phosphate dehydrogenase/oxidase [Desulfonema ishimotonii]GBC61607.1 glycerol-3-phosphate dehydrogenase/oxidase [Desulfonema ishimotonii]